MNTNDDKPEEKNPEAPVPPTTENPPGEGGATPGGGDEASAT